MSLSEHAVTDKPPFRISEEASEEIRRVATMHRIKHPVLRLLVKVDRGTFSLAAPFVMYKHFSDVGEYRTVLEPDDNVPFAIVTNVERGMLEGKVLRFTKCSDADLERGGFKLADDSIWRSLENAEYLKQLTDEIAQSPVH